MSKPSSPMFDRDSLREIAKKNLRRLKQLHLPSGGLARPVLRALYHSHVAMRECRGWLARFLWYEPLFRSQCLQVGRKFRMEQLPYVVGCGDIKIGDEVQFSGKPSFTFSSHYSSNPCISIGQGTFLGHASAIIVGRSISIGDHCLIASSVRMSDFDGHPLDAQLRREGHPALAEDVRPIRIGNDVWIGYAASILKGVHIGDRAVIGAHAVVTRDVAADTVVAGNPARCVKSLPSPTDGDK